MESFHYWLILAILGLTLEIFTGTLFLMGIALSAFVSAAIAWLGLGVEYQLLAFSIICITISVVLYKRKSVVKENYTLDAGNTGTIMEVKSSHELLVAYQGSQWPAKFAEETDPGSVLVGQQVRILRIEGISLVVEKS